MLITRKRKGKRRSQSVTTTRSNCIRQIKVERKLSTRAVRPLLSVSFGSKPRLSSWCNNKLSPLTAAKHRVRGRSILPRASIFSVSAKTPSITGFFSSFKYCIRRRKDQRSTKNSNCCKYNSNKWETWFSTSIWWNHGTFNSWILFWWLPCSILDRPFWGHLQKVLSDLLHTYSMVGSINPAFAALLPWDHM